MARGSGVVYGQSGTLKTTAGKHFSRYIYEVTGKRTLLFSMDGGGWGPMTPEIDAGIIVPYRGNQQVPLPVIRKVSQGYWPKDSGETEIEKTNLSKINFEEFGGLVVEGLTSISQVLMRYLADKAIKTGEEATNAFTQGVIVDGQVVNEVFAGNSRGHYGFVQNQLYGLVSNMLSLPFHYILFTALESKTEDDDRSTVYGPQVAGKKATNLVPSWVGDCLHSEGFQVTTPVMVPDPQDPSKRVQQNIIETKVRTYFVKHPDPVTGINFPAKPRVTPEQVGALMKQFPGGYYEPTPEHGFDTYLHTIDRITSQQTDAVARWRAEMDAKRKAQQEQPKMAEVVTPAVAPAK